MYLRTTNIYLLHPSWLGIRIVKLSSYNSFNVRLTWSIVRASESFLHYDNSTAGCTVSVEHRKAGGGGRLSCGVPGWRGDTTANWNNDRGRTLLIHENSIWRRNVTDQINHSITFYMYTGTLLRKKLTIDTVWHHHLQWKTFLFAIICIAVAIQSIRLVYVKISVFLSLIYLQLVINLTGGDKWRNLSDYLSVSLEVGDVDRGEERGSEVADRVRCR